MITNKVYLINGHLWVATDYAAVVDTNSKPINKAQAANPDMDVNIKSVIIRWKPWYSSGITPPIFGRYFLELTDRLPISCEPIIVTLDDFYRKSDDSRFEQMFKEYFDMADQLRKKELCMLEGTMTIAQLQQELLQEHQ